MADETREGEVYRTLLDKIEQAREALGGQVFDVLGKVQFDGRPLKELLIEAIRYGEQPDVRARLMKVVENAFDRGQLQDLLEERALAHDAMDASRVFRIREEMERAEARRLQPHYIESFFLEGFKRLGGAVKQREPRRYEVTHVPATVRNRDRQIGIGEPVLPRYERIAFEKSLVSPQGQPLAAFVCPGHPLLDATIDLTLERHRAEQLKIQEQAGKSNARLNSNEARKRADILQTRLEKRMEELAMERQISPLPPVVMGGLLVIPARLIAQITGKPLPALSVDTQAIAAQARAIVMDVERRLGFEPTDREFERLGYDIESRVPWTGKLRFIEVKGRASGAETITVTRNEVLYSLNKPDDFILAMVEFFPDGAHRVHYLRRPFQREPEFTVISQNHDFAELLTRASEPS